MALVKVKKQELDKVGELLNDPTKPLKQRFRALFTLRSIGGKDGIDHMVKAFSDSSALLKHEVAYCLGQLGDKYAIPFLVDVLKNVNEEPMVRHEAGEALGAIGQAEMLPLLEQYSKDPVPEVAETCFLAVKRIEWLENEKKAGNVKIDGSNAYLSIDPAPAHSSIDVRELKAMLLNEELNLFDRYRAMFALRNLGSAEAVEALSEGLKCTKSALFRHEIGFVFGQMQREESIPALIKNVYDSNENDMVRHECAEALGSIGTNECNEVLKKFMKDHARVVRESCEIALDISDYENSNNLQYANVLETVRAEDM